MRRTVGMRIRLYIDKRPNKEGLFPVRLSVSLAGKRQLTTLGVSMTETQFNCLLCAYENKECADKEKHIRHSELLRTLRTLANKLEWEEEKIRRGEIKSDDVDLAFIINSCKGREVKEKSTEYTFDEVYIKFMISEKRKKDLSERTMHYLTSLKNDINEHYPTITLSTIATKKWIQEFIDDNISRGLSNVSIRSKYRSLHWFLVWAYQNEYCGNDFMAYRFELKIVESREKLVVFLTMEEIQRIQLLTLPPHLDLYRDIFLFQCFTGLRYSDVSNLRNTDINGDTMTLVTQKTGVSLQNKLNRYALELVNKYKGRYGEKLFPTISLTNINHFVKEIGKLAGIDEPVTKIEYRNHRREEMVLPKWQLLSSHVGRKSFITNSLDLGLTATQVIGYTGHSSITAMQPYISISQKKKDAAMDVWDNATTAPDTEISKIEAEIKALEERLRALKSAADKD